MFTASVPVVYELVKVGVLFEHFHEHEGDHTLEHAGRHNHDLSIIDFIAEHYGDSKHKQDKQHDHTDLPLMIGTTNLTYVAVVRMQGMTLPAPVVDEGASMLTSESLLPYHATRTIFQPPRA